MISPFDMSKYMEERFILFSNITVIPLHQGRESMVAFKGVRREAGDFLNI